MRTANLAIVFTDIKGFTERTSAQTLEENERLLATHNELLAPLFRALGGRIVKTIGDAFLVTFEAPTAAVLSGLAVQDALWAYNRTAAPGRQLHVRVAINVGEVRLEGGDVFGEPVNIAARVEGLAEAGEVTLTEAVYLSMNRAEVPCEEVGRFELKGIPEPVRVYRATKGADGPGGPPFGNKGLDRAAGVGRGGDAPARALEAAGTALSRTGQLADEVLASTGNLLRRSLEGAPARRPLPRGLAAAGALGLAAVLLWGLVRLWGDETGRAIDAAVRARPQERGRLVDAARKLIAKEKDPARRSLALGRLGAGLGDETAVGHLVSAARKGAGGAEALLIDLLEHERCPLRAAAADAVADLGLARARGALEDLARRGGPDDGEVVLVFGCNSRRSATDALARLKE